MLGRLLEIWRDAGANRTRSFGRSTTFSSRRAFFEPLESRRVLAADIVINTAGLNDVINIGASGDDLIVQVNGGSSQTHYGPIASITVNAGDGDDTINLNGLPTSAGGSSVVNEISTNHSPGAAAQDLEALTWSTSTDNANIDDGNGFPVSDPHVTVNATFDGNSDYFRIVLSLESLVRIDIDMPIPEMLDSFVQLVNASDVVVPDKDGVLAEIDDGPDDAGSDVNASTGFVTDSFFLTTMPAGEYFIRVKDSPFALDPFTPGATYQMHVSIVNHASGGSGTPTVVINGGSGSDTLTVGAAILTESSDPYLVAVGQQPFVGQLMHQATSILSYETVETFNGGGTFNVQVDLADLSAADTIADTTYVRPDAGGSTLLIDFNGVTYFGGGLSQLSVIEIIGSSDSDTVTIENVIQNAIVYGNAGDDVIHSSAGTDSLFGGDGNDWITGGDGDDRIYGNAGNDQLGGNGGNDIVSGGTGDDQVVGQSGIDLLLGGDGADHVLGNNDRDLLFANGATRDSDPSHDGDAQDIFDHDYHEMFSLLGSWIGGNLGISGFVSNGSDGDVDRLQGGRDDDWFLYSAADGDLVIDNQDEIPPPQ